MAGGYKSFGPTYKTTDLVRLGYEGTLNGTHDIDVEAVEAVNGELAGKIAAMGANGVTLSNAGAKAIGLFREDLNDMVNASLKATFYFRGGEYYVSESRLGTVGSTKQTAADLAVGDELTTDANGGLVKLVEGSKAVGVVTHVGEYKAGNMYEHANASANGGNYIGFILYL